jgi:hypothetical protein
MDPKEYAQLRAERTERLKAELPTAAADIRLVSTPARLVRPAQQYLRKQREQMNQSGFFTPSAAKE